MEFNFASLKRFLQNKENIKKLLKTGIPLLLIYVVFLWAADQFGVNRESVQAYFAGKGALLIPAFIGAQLLASLTPLPDLPFLVVGILFFQPWFAFLLILFGMWLGTIVNFFVARKLGRNYIKKQYPQTTEWIDKFTGDYGIETVVMARSFTFVPFDIIGYAAGVSNMKFAQFVAASVIGLIPIALNATLIGIALTSTLDAEGVTAGSILRSTLVFALTASLSVLLGWLANQYRKRSQNTQKHNQDSETN